MQYLLDTSICVFYLRGKLNLDQIIREKGQENFFISEITILELRYGAENSDNPSKSHKAVDDFINGLSIIPIFWKYVNNLTLVTDNAKDFERLHGIKIENWYKRKSKEG